MASSAAGWLGAVIKDVAEMAARKRWHGNRGAEHPERNGPCSSSTGLSSGAQKLGQPVPLSNLVLDENAGSSQPAQENVPARCSSSSALVKGRSVLATEYSYCSGVKSLRHSSSYG